MSVYYKHYDLDYIVPTCYERSGVDKKELMEFEMTDDLEHIPDSREIKLYIRCWNELSESVDLKANKMLLSKFGELLADFTKEEKEIFIGFGKGCIRRIKPITDPIEWSYALIVCYKQNDNKVCIGSTSCL